MINDDEIVDVLKYLIKKLSRDHRSNDRAILDYIHSNASRHARMAVIGLVKEALKENNTKLHDFKSISYYDDTARVALHTALEFRNI